MTLIITAVAPDAIIMGTDSAVSLMIPDVPSELVYSGLKKLFLWAPMGIGVSIFGTFPIHIDKLLFSDWMQSWYHREYGDKAIDPDSLAKQLCTNLDKVIPEYFKSPVGLHLAMWVTSGKFPGTKIPIVIEITRVNNKYAYKELLGVDIIQHIYNHRINSNSPYPAVFFAAGLPNLRKQEMANLRDLFSKIVRAPVPAPSSLHLNEYVRLLITTVAHLYMASGLPNYVSVPVETLYLPPETIYGMSMRF